MKQVLLNSGAGVRNRMDPNHQHHPHDDPHKRKIIHQKDITFHLLLTSGNSEQKLTLEQSQLEDRKDGYGQHSGDRRTEDEIDGTHQKVKLEVGTLREFGVIQMRIDKSF